MTELKMNEERSVVWKCLKCSAFHNWTWSKCDVFPGEIFMECDSCGAKTKMIMEVDKNGNGLAMPFPEDNELEEKLRRAAEKIMNSKTELEPNQIIKDGDCIYFRGERYQKEKGVVSSVEKQPKTLFDVIRNLGYSCDCSWEIVDAIEEFEKQKIMKNLKTSLKEMVNGDVRPIDDVMKEAKKPQTLYDICADWYKDYDEDHPMDDLVEYIVRNWLPKPIDYKAMGIGKHEWIDGYNAYRKTLIDTLGGESDY